VADAGNLVIVYPHSENEFVTHDAKLDYPANGAIGLPWPSHLETTAR
jgi:hypothetical protein